MIWRLSGGSGGSSIFGGKASVETWRCIATLRSHEADVLDLAWAPHSPWLASASVDNSVIVWDASKFPAIVAVLKGHTGFVKGITWDLILFWMQVGLLVVSGLQLVHGMVLLYLLNLHNKNLDSLWIPPNKCVIYLYCGYLVNVYNISYTGRV